MVKVILMGLAVNGLLLNLSAEEASNAGATSVFDRDNVKQPLSAENERKLKYEIIPGLRVGKITRQTTRADLVAWYGEANVQEKNFEQEGLSMLVTHVRVDPHGEGLKIIWNELDGKKLPETIFIEGVAWKTKEGIGLGTTLERLEELNGRPFILAGFGWDYSGTVYDFKGGRLEPLKSALTIRLHPGVEYQTVLSEKEYLTVVGDKEISSDNPIMRKLKPEIYQLIMRFKNP